MSTSVPVSKSTSTSTSMTIILPALGSGCPINPPLVGSSPVPVPPAHSCCARTNSNGNVITTEIPNGWNQTSSMEEAEVYSSCPPWT